MVQRSGEQSSIGYKVAISGGILALLAVLVLPYVSIGIFGSYTAIQLASGVFGYSSPSLWLEPLVALVIIALAGFSLHKRSGNTAPAAIIFGLSCIALLVLILTYIQQSMQTDFFGSAAASYYSTGFWLYLAGITAALVGGFFALSTKGQLQLPGQQQPLPSSRQPQQPNWPPQSPSQPPYGPPQP